MNKLVVVFEGILDEKEFLDFNTSCIETVQAYAENGMGVYLTRAEAKMVREALLNWVEGTESGALNGTDDYYTIIKPLEEFESENQI